MKQAEGKITNRFGNYAKAKLDMGEGAAGVCCPYCGLYFVVIATDDLKHPMRPIPINGKVDYFCPACGKNLKDDLVDMIKGG